MRTVQLTPKFRLETIGKHEESETLKVTVFIPMILGWIEKMKFVVSVFNGVSLYALLHQKNEDGYAIFEGEVTLKNRAIYNFYFTCECSGEERILKFDEKSRKVVLGDNSIKIDEMFKTSIGFEVPKWAEGEILYFIFIDRFYRARSSEQIEAFGNRTINSWTQKAQIGPNSNGDWNVDFYGGDLKGITEKLDYIKSLGTGIIYISPIVMSQSNHRYDTANYEVVDPYVGTNADLKELCDEAHAKGIKIIIDAVFNHTGNDSIYFNEYGNYPTIGAYQSPDSPYFSFYKRAWVSGRSDFSYWWGMKNLPECNSYSKEWQEYITGVGGVIDKWFGLGIDGLRLDVADELSDEMIELIRSAVERNKPDGFVIGEVWKNPMRMNRGYISSGKGMHSVMNYLLVDALIRFYKYSDTYKLDDVIRQILHEYPDGTINCLMNFTSTHDISRIIEILGGWTFNQYGEWAWNLSNESLDFVKWHEMTKEEYDFGKEVLFSYIVGLAFLPGMFSIFYGDEVGLKGIGNLANRAPFPWDCGDEEILEYFREVGKVRNKNLFLKTARLHVIRIDNMSFVYEREDGESKIIVAVSRSHHVTRIGLTDLGENLEEAEVIFRNGDSNLEYLSPYGAIVVKI